MTTPLRVPIFRAVWVAAMTSHFGSMIQTVGASWMMASLVDSPKLIALVQSSASLPVMLLSLWAGALADNFDRRRIMLCAQGFMCIVSVTLAICAWIGVLTPWLLLTFTFLVGCGMAMHIPAWQASVGDMVPREMLSSAVGLNSVGFNLARSAGPALGGVIVATAGAAAAFFINSLSYFGLITVLLRWRPAAPPPALPRERLGIAMAAGIRYVWMSPDIRLTLTRSFYFSLAATAMPALTPLVARDMLGGGPLVYGALMCAFGVGAVSGALTGNRVRKTMTTEHVIQIGALLTAAGVAIVSIGGALPISVVALFLVGAGWVLSLSTFNVHANLAAPRWVVARALSLFQMGSFAGLAVGSWLFGWIADALSVAAALQIAAAVLVSGVLLGVCFPLSQSGAENLEPLGTWSEPEVGAPADPSSGPIVVTIEYRIATEDVPPFLLAMGERRRVRQRDGALGWRLTQDLGNTALWYERYHVPTWLDYVRHNQRRTHADRETSESVLALHSGPDAPRITRAIERQSGSGDPGPAADARAMAERNA